MSSPEPKHNRITNAEDNKVKPVFCQTFCYAFALLLGRSAIKIWPCQTCILTCAKNISI